jgi:hypothetical protein
VYLYASAQALLKRPATQNRGQLQPFPQAALQYSNLINWRFDDNQLFASRQLHRDRKHRLPAATPGAECCS